MYLNLTRQSRPCGINFSFMQITGFTCRVLATCSSTACHPYLHLLLCGRSNVTAAHGGGERRGAGGSRLFLSTIVVPQHLESPPPRASSTRPAPGTGRGPQTARGQVSARAEDAGCGGAGGVRGTGPQRQGDKAKERVRPAGERWAAARGKEGGPGPRKRRPRPAALPAGPRPDSFTRPSPTRTPAARPRRRPRPTSLRTWEPRASGPRRCLRCRAALAPGPKWRGPGLRAEPPPLPPPPRPPPREVELRVHR